VTITTSKRPGARRSSKRAARTTKALRRQAGGRTSRARRRARSATPYLQRLIESDDLQLQLRTAAERIGDVYGRVARQGTRATEDKRMYASMREAATSIRRAVGELTEPPRRSRRRLRKLLGISLGVGAAALAARALSSRMRGGTGEPSFSEGSASNGVWHEPENVPAPAAPAG
jgi:hypothetical protein